MAMQGLKINMDDALPHMRAIIAAAEQQKDDVARVLGNLRELDGLTGNVKGLIEKFEEIDLKCNQALDAAKDGMTQLVAYTKEIEAHSAAEISLD